MAPFLLEDGDATEGLTTTGRRDKKNAIVGLLLAGVLAAGGSALKSTSFDRKGMTQPTGTEDSDSQRVLALPVYFPGEIPTNPDARCEPKAMADRMEKEWKEACTKGVVAVSYFYADVYRNVSLCQKKNRDASPIINKFKDLDHKEGCEGIRPGQVLANAASAAIYDGWHPAFLHGFLPQIHKLAAETRKAKEMGEIKDDYCEEYAERDFDSQMVLNRTVHCEYEIEFFYTNSINITREEDYPELQSLAREAAKCLFDTGFCYVCNTTYKPLLMVAEHGSIGKCEKLEENDWVKFAEDYFDPDLTACKLRVVDMDYHGVDLRNFTPGDEAHGVDLHDFAPEDLVLETKRLMVTLQRDQGECDQLGHWAEDKRLAPMSFSDLSKVFIQAPGLFGLGEHCYYKNMGYAGYSQYGERIAEIATGPNPFRKADKKGPFRNQSKSRQIHWCQQHCAGNADCDFWEWKRSALMCYLYKEQEMGMIKSMPSHVKGLERTTGNAEITIGNRRSNVDCSWQIPKWMWDERHGAPHRR